CARGRGSLDVW
nr:immunoglobulin heavy chain junction region [Macaca mulatta]